MDLSSFNIILEYINLDYIKIILGFVFVLGVCVKVTTLEDEFLKNTKRIMILNIIIILLIGGLFATIIGERLLK